MLNVQIEVNIKKHIDTDLRGIVFIYYRNFKYTRGALLYPDSIMTSGGNLLKVSQMPKSVRVGTKSLLQRYESVYQQTREVLFACHPEPGTANENYRRFSHHVLVYSSWFSKLQRPVCKLEYGSLYAECSSAGEPALCINRASRELQLLGRVERGLSSRCTQTLR